MMCDVSPLFLWAVLAYLDPGSGSYILQILIASLLGGLFAVKVFWSKIKALLAKLFTRKSGGS